MISVKAIAAIALTGLGGITSGTAAYLEGHQMALTRADAGHDAAPSQDAPRQVGLPQPVVVEASTAEAPVVIEPVLISGRLHARRPVPARVQNTESSASSACSDWQDLATGPAGRRVRMLCTH